MATERWMITLSPTAAIRGALAARLLPMMAIQTVMPSRAVSVGT